MVFIVFRYDKSISFIPSNICSFLNIDTDDKCERLELNIEKTLYEYQESTLLKNIITTINIIISLISTSEKEQIRNFHNKFQETHIKNINNDLVYIKNIF